MKLSEAIRLGAMLRPQSHDVFFDQRAQTTCALGAAYEATLGNLAEEGATGRQLLRDVYPILDSRVGLPACGCAWRDIDAAADLESVIIHLNDRHKWTREKIADWIATVEARTEQLMEKEAVCLL